MIAAIYARKSTDQNGVSEEQKSVARQIEHAKAYADSKGWTVDENSIFVDDGISGAEFANRPGFLRMMNALKPKPPFQVLIMSEESRLGRESIETAYALKQLVQAGVRVFFYLSGTERTLNSAMEKAMLALQAMSDDMEREKARQRTYDAMLRKAKAGHVTGGKVFGYDNIEVLGPDGKRSHVVHRINEGEAAVIRRMFELYAAGHGYPKIAKMLNAEGVPSPRAQRGRPNGWSPSSVREALLRTLYRGQIVWNRTQKRDPAWGRKKVRDRSESEWLTVPAEDLRIIAEPLWEKVQRRVAAGRARYLGNTGRGGREPGSGAKYLLTGLLRCGICGAGIEARSRSHGKKREVFYGCSAYHRKGKTVCPNAVTIPAEVLDDKIIEAVSKKVLSAKVLQAVVDRALAKLSTPQPQRSGSERELAAINAELRRLADAIAAGGDAATLVAAIQAREVRKKQLEQALAAKPASAQLNLLKVRKELVGVAEEWRAVLKKHVPKGQTALRQLIKGRLSVTPKDQEIEILGSGTVVEVIRAVLPQNLASLAVPTSNQLSEILGQLAALKTTGLFPRCSETAPASVAVHV